MVDLRDLERRNDGVSDALTLTMAPQLFHHNLKRELAAAQREARDLSVLAINLKPEAFTDLADFSQALISLAFLLRSEQRGGDFFARISDGGFWAVLRTGPEHDREVAAVIERLALATRTDLDYYIVARKQGSYDEWISRLDLIHFGAGTIA